MKLFIAGLTALILGTVFSSHAQTIHYVDADLTNTTIGGAAPNIGVNVTSPDRPADDGIWGYDNDSNWANPNPDDGAIWAAGGAESVPEIATTITGLTPNGAYAIYSFGWSSGTTWDMEAGLVSGALTQFRGSTENNVDFLGDVNDGDIGNDNPITATTGTIGGEAKTFSAPLEISEGNRDIYVCQLGVTTASESGEITVYIDDFAGADRTWYDGVGYEVVSDFPTFQTQPMDATAILGGGVVFTAAADSPEPISYQWKRNNVDIPDETSETLTLSEVVPSDTADIYTVVATNSKGAVTSDPAQVTAVVLPDITPQSLLVFPTFDAEFAITMPEGAGYSYAWSGPGGPIAGAVGDTLSILNAGISDAGTYSVEVTFSTDTLTTTAELIVPDSPALSYTETITASAPVAYWRLGESEGAEVASDEIGSEDLLIGENVVLGQSGAIIGDPNTSMGFDGTTDAVLEGDGNVPSLNTAVFSVECWARPTGGNGRRTVFGSRDVNAGDGNNTTGYEVGLNADGEWEFRTGQGGPNAWNTLNGPAAAINEWTQVIATFDGSTMKLYLNGVIAGTLAADTFVPQVEWEIRIGGGANEAFPAEDLFVGGIGEVSFYDRALSDSDALDHFVASVDLTAPPIIAAQPANNGTVIGTSATLTVAVQSGTAPSFQWRRGGLDIPGETGQSLVFDPVAIDDGGTYDVVVSNTNGTVTSDPVQFVPLADYLGTLVEPDATNTILNRNGSTTWFGENIAATDGDGLWRQRPVFAIFPGISTFGYQATTGSSGAADGELEVQTTISGLTPGVDYAVWTLVSNKAGFSAGVQAGFEGDEIMPIAIGDMIDTGEISVTVADPWNILHGFLGIRAANASGEISVNVDFLPGGTRTVYNGLGYQLAVPAVTPPVITVNPASLTIPLGADATYTVSVSSAVEVSYQWQKDEEDIVGATESALVVSGVDGDSAGQYRVVVSNSEGSTNSTSAYLVPVFDLVGNFVFPDASNTVLERDGSAIFSDADEIVAEDGGLWTESPDLGVPGQSSSAYGLLGTPDNETNGDIRIETTIPGLDPNETYAVWALYAFAPGSFGDRLSAGLVGRPIKTYDNSFIDTGLDTGDTGQFNIHHGLLGVAMPNASGEISAVADFQGLNRTMFLGYGYQTSTLPSVLVLNIQEIGGNIILSYPQGTLEESADLGQTDPWTAIPGAISPFVWPGTEPKHYFRVAE